MAKQAILSVWDKNELLELAQGLDALGFRLIASGGTARGLREAGLPVQDVADLTGAPEMLDGRVKTLHPAVHGGILAIRDNPQHMQTIQQQDITPSDMVVCNLYPFEATVAKPGSSHEDIVENIDIGGPSMVRSAAKNYHDVAIVTDPRQYEEIAAELRENNGSLTLPTRERLAAAGRGDPRQSK